MFYAALAMLATINRDSSKHIGVIAIFDEQFVKPKYFSKRNE